MDDLEKTISDIAAKHRNRLAQMILERESEMRLDDRSHALLYRVLGVPEDEGFLIDLYQNKGRLLYKYAGAFAEEAAFLCFKHKYPHAKKEKFRNPFGNSPKSFEIDCLVDSLAHEIKWRDATTDGDHINKEKKRAEAIKAAGMTPIRLMFFYPNRKQAAKIQKSLASLYSELGGQYYAGSAAFAYIKEKTGFDLLSFFLKEANFK